MLEIELQSSLEQGLMRYSQEVGQPVQQCLNDAVASYLDDMEDMRIAKERLANQGKHYTSDELSALLNQR